MDILQKADFAVADEILAPQFIWRNPSFPFESAHGPQSTKKLASLIIDAIPDRQITHEDIIAEGDKVLIRWSITGIPKQELLGIPSGNKPIILTGFDLFRISDGKIVELWQQYGFGRWQ